MNDIYVAWISKYYPSDRYFPCTRATTVKGVKRMKLAFPDLQVVTGTYGGKDHVWLNSELTIYDPMKNYMRRGLVYMQLGGDFLDNPIFPGGL